MPCKLFDNIEADCALDVCTKENCCYWEPVPTNADRIRAMSDERMSVELIPIIQELCEDGIPTREFLLKWLQQPVEEEAE